MSTGATGFLASFPPRCDPHAVASSSQLCDWSEWTESVIGADFPGFFGWAEQLGAVMEFVCEYQPTLEDILSF